MKWFKHMTAMRSDPKVQELIAWGGMEAYGRLLTLMEILAAEGKAPLYAYTASRQWWCGQLHVRGEKFEKTLTKVGLLFNFTWENSDLGVTCMMPKLSKYHDEYTRKQRRSPDTVRSDSDSRRRRREEEKTPARKLSKRPEDSEKREPQQRAHGPTHLGSILGAIAQN